MTILLYDYCELEERASKHLKVWKVWHILLFVFAAVFGLMNYVFLQKTMELVDHNCFFYPRSLDFELVDLMSIPNSNDTSAQDPDNFVTTPASTLVINTTVATDKVTSTTAVDKVKRNADHNGTLNGSDGNVTTPAPTEAPETSNATHRLFLVTSRVLSASPNDCQFAEYMPLLSTVFAAVWTTMFTMCAGGGRVRTGLQQPWRVLAPALLFSLLMVALTGHSFIVTNGGLHAFCAAFHNLTNTTACSPVNEFLKAGWREAWGFGGRAAATRAASAGVLASWACAAALLLARCLAAPDFQVIKTGAYLKDPQQKLTPYLKKSRSNLRSNPTSPRQGDASVRSEPTITTELVTVEPGQDSAPTSLMVTPVKTPRNTENIELAYSPREFVESSR